MRSQSPPSLQLATHLEDYFNIFLCCMSIYWAHEQTGFSQVQLWKSVLLPILTSAFLAASPIDVYRQRVLWAVGWRTENPATLYYTILEEKFILFFFLNPKHANIKSKTLNAHCEHTVFACGTAKKIHNEHMSPTCLYVSVYLCTNFPGIWKLYLEKHPLYSCSIQYRPTLNG